MLQGVLIKKIYLQKLDAIQFQSNLSLITSVILRVWL